MESMAKYMLLMILVALATIASTAKGDAAIYKGSKGEPIWDGVCGEVDVNKKKTVTVPEDIWPGNNGGCKNADFTCADSELCKQGSKVTAFIVGESGPGNTFTLSTDAFNAIANDGATSIGLVYIP